MTTTEGQSRKPLNEVSFFRRGGKICLTDHFKPLWGRNAPKFGIAHAMALGLGPWLAVEIPEMIQKGVVTYKEKS